ncbi:MAG: hypothetical protein RRY29_02060 [Desulfovibrionaceae bacterium]
MKIQTEQLDALFKQQELHAKQTLRPGKEDFGATLAQELGLTAGATPAPGTVPLPGSQHAVIGQMLLGNAENTAAPASALETVMQQTLAQASGALDTWESYLGALGQTGKQGGTLRDAYGLLQGLDTQVAALKQKAQPVLGQNPALASIVQELDVMTATEKVKFNRGDYV